VRRGAESKAAEKFNITEEQRNRLVADSCTAASGLFYSVARRGAGE
jgi:hypothetical protein